MIETKDLHEAVDRIARTPDGRTLYVFLQAKLMEVPGSLESGALRRHDGERSFAAKLIGLMAKGIADSDGRTNSSTNDPGGPAQPVVVIAGARAVDAGRTRRPRGNERRVTADTYVAGYDAPADGTDQA